jgi:uncharacterized membrane protein (DUF485 family)
MLFEAYLEQKAHFMVQVTICYFLFFGLIGLISFNVSILDRLEGRSQYLNINNQASAIFQLVANSVNFRL